MAMTPIKVRGKRASAQTESMASSKTSLNSLLNLYPNGKRPASHFPIPPAKLPRHNNNNVCGNSGKRARFGAPLELLPTELLETIFLHNLNISLPQASSIIGSKLASKHVKTQLVLRVCSAGRIDTYPGEQAVMFPSMADHAEAQSAILRMRWMTLPFIRQLVIDYVTKTIVREFSRRGLQWLGIGPLVNKETESTIRQYLEDRSARLTKKNQDDLPVFGNVSWCVGKPPRFIRVTFELHDGLVSIEERPMRGLGNFAQHVGTSSAEHDQWMIFCGINGCKIPGKLLHGPWTTEKCDFLEMLIRGNATVDWVGTTSGEMAERGLLQALLEGNARATRLLVTRARSGHPRGLWGLPYSSNRTKIEKLAIGPGPSGSINIEKLDAGPWPKEDLFHADASSLRGVGVVPRTEHLRTAVLEAGCQQDIIEALFMAEDTNIDVEDRLTLDWAVRKRYLGDERGPWLLATLSSKPSRSIKQHLRGPR